MISACVSHIGTFIPPKWFSVSCKQYVFCMAAFPSTNLSNCWKWKVCFRFLFFWHSSLVFNKCFLSFPFYTAFEVICHCPSVCFFILLNTPVKYIRFPTLENYSVFLLFNNGTVIWIYWITEDTFIHFGFVVSYLY